jgi:hypothetical protein
LNIDWDIYAQVEKNRIMYELSVIPYLWIVFLAASVFYANYFFNQTNKGYRYKRSGILVGSVAVGAIFGVSFYFYGLAEEIDNYLLETIPCYHQITGNHAVLWMNPNKGLLAGIVLATTSRGFVVMDFSGKNWDISSGLTSEEAAFLVQQKQWVKIVGETSGPEAFVARNVRLWNGGIEPNSSCAFAR